MARISAAILRISDPTIPAATEERRGAAGREGASTGIMRGFGAGEGEGKMHRSAARVEVRWAAVGSFSTQPLVPMLGDELVVGELRVAAHDAVDLRLLVGREPLSGVERPHAAHQPLAAE